MFRDGAAAGVAGGTGAAGGAAAGSISLAIGTSARGLVFTDSCGVGHSTVFEFAVSAPLAALSIANARTKETLAALVTYYDDPDGAVACRFR
jgi:hypothetical protein